QSLDSALTLPMPERTPAILCFGEILWDFLPEGLFPGGAPFNVAYHLHRLGANVRLLSGVGRDLLGDELLRRLKAWGIATDALARHQGLPTGYVVATVAPNGDATYEIVPSVAWDQIAVPEDGVRAAMHARALVFGSLSQRSTFNRAALDRLLAVLPATAWRVFDVNLRPPHDDLELVRALARQATLLKLNSAEAARLAAGGAESPGREEADARALAAQAGSAIVCVTAGARGAGLLRGGAWHWEPGREVAVADTVGAGDAFLAALLTGLLDGQLSDRDCLARACRLGEWVATQRGATPTYPANPACA
ncbi:MAG: carbohydrate kinase, partial [Opitutales bacterium]